MAKMKFAHMATLFRTRTRLDAAILALCAALLSAGWALTLERVRYEQANEIQDVQTDNSNLAIAFDAHTARTLKGVNQLLVIVAQEFDNEGASLNLRGMLQAALDPSMVSNVAIADRDGRVVLST